MSNLGFNGGSEDGYIKLYHYGGQLKDGVRN